MPVFCKYIKNKMKNEKIKKTKNKKDEQIIVSTSSKVPTDDCFTRPINR